LKVLFKRNNSEEFGQSRPVSTNLFTSEVAKEYDSINEYDSIPEDIEPLKAKGEQYTTHSTINRPLPDTPLDVYEDLDVNTTNAKANYIISRRICILMFKILLMLTVVVLFVVIVVVTTMVMVIQANDKKDGKLFVYKNIFFFSSMMSFYVIISYIYYY